jgi:hypothetical protein
MKKIYLLCISVLLFSTGCKKFLDININPSVPQVANAEVLLPPILYQMTNGTAQDNRVLWKITQNMAGISSDLSSVNWEKHGFPAASDAGGVMWRMTYVDLGLNLENLLKDAEENKKYEYAGIGYAVKAWAYQLLTDYHGPIILGRAFDPTLLRFPYEDQPAVYAKVREWCDLSLKYLNSTGGLNVAASLSGATGDYMYKGDKAKWKKFVYGLLALQYSHLVNKPEFKTKYADSVIKYVNLSFANETESATMGFQAASTNDTNPIGPGFNYLYPSSTTTYYGRPTTTIINYLTGGINGTPVSGATSSIDPRLSRMLLASTTTGAATLGKYIGVPPTTAAAVSGVMHVYGKLTGAAYVDGYYIFADKARYPLMTYSQLQFAKAEAYFLKDDKTNAYTSYIAAIRAHMDFVNQYGRVSVIAPAAISAAEITAYLASTEVAQNATDLKMSDIMGQKYIAQWGWAGVEQWCDLRKYHYDPLVFKQYVQLTNLHTNNNGKFAYRVRPRYNSEYVWNQEELEKWGALNRDYMTYETWFSQP